MSIPSANTNGGTPTAETAVEVVATNNPQTAGGVPAGEQVVADVTVKANPQPEFLAPPHLKDKPWAGKIRNTEDAWKQLESLQEVVGKKNIVAKLDYSKATPAEIEEFYAQTRPADKSAYQFIEGTPDSEREMYSDLLYKHGIPAEQGNVLIKAVQEKNKAEAEKFYDRDDFFKRTETVFGKDYKEKIGAAKKAVDGVIGADLAKRVDAMPNEHHVAFYEAVNKIIDKYGVTESGIQVNAPSTVPSADVSATQNDLRKQIADISKRPHTAEEKKALIDQLTATYKA